MREEGGTNCSVDSGTSTRRHKTVSSLKLLKVNFGVKDTKSNFGEIKLARDSISMNSGLPSPSGVSLMKFQLKI